MATLATNALTIADVTRSIGPDGDAAMIAELLNQTNAVLDDIPWLPGNLLHGHRSTVRTTLPTVAARVANVGTSHTKATEAQIDDAAAIFETKSELDKIVAETGGMDMVPIHRANQARAHIEAIGQKMATTLFYGSPAVSEEFVGLANRYNSLTTGNFIDNVIDAGGTGSDNSSIWLVQWGPGKVHGIYPKGTIGGLERDDRGLVDIIDATGIGAATFVGYREYFRWRCGLAVPDWRCVVRIANIDISALVAMSSFADLTELMIQALETIPNPDGGRLVFYMNRTVRKGLRLIERNDVQGGGQLKYEDIAGRRVLMFDNAAVRLVDALTETESAVT